MTAHRPVARATLAAAALALLAGCAAPAIDANVAAARAELAARGGPDFTWLATDAARDQARADVERTLRQPLAADDAVRVALAHSPALQALLFERAAASADATQAARLPNPVFAFERFAAGGAGPTELTRALSVPLLDILLLPARAQQADAAQRRLRLQLAADVLRAAADARVAWVDAVAARQSLASAERADDAVEAAAELARRLEASGAFSAQQRALAEAATADTLLELARARRAQRDTREALVRALGLDDAQAAALTLPDALPELPAALAPAQPTQQAAIEQRLDLRLARARLDELARTQGVARVGQALAGADIGVERRSQADQPKERGLALAVPLPVFDTGDAAHAGAVARVEAARARTAALAIAAASQLRAADADRRESLALALRLRDELVPLRAKLLDESLRRYNAMLASPFDLLADAREQARTLAQSVAAQRDFWRADAAWQSATLGVPSSTLDIAEAP